MKPQHLAITCEVLRPACVASEQTHHLAKHFIGRGYNVSVLAGGVIEADLDDRVQLHSAGLEAPRSARAIRRLRRWHAQKLSELSPDHAVSLTTLIPAEVLLPLEGTAAGYRESLRKRTAPLPIRAAAWAQSLLPGLTMRVFAERQALKDPTLRICAAITPVIEAQLRSAISAEHVRFESIAAPCKTDGAPSIRAHDMREQLARGLNLPIDAPWLLFPFRSGWADGIEPMVLAFRQLADRGSDAVLLLAGPSKYTHLAWIGQLGLRDRVRFVGTPDVPEQLVAAADLVVQPTSYDPGGWGIRPAIECGRPVITTSVSGAAELARDRGGTVLDAPVDPRQLAQAIEQGLEGRSAGSAPQPPPPQPAPGGSSPAFADAIEALLSPEPPVSSS